MVFKRRTITPAQIIILSFLAMIFIGTLLLMLPWATQNAQGASFSDALFTATSATCVTGLVVQDTATYWSGFGQAVILLLIQIGGMGVVTVAVAIFMVSGKRIGLKQRWVMQESISAPQVGGIVRLTGFILKSTFLMEGIGALLLAFRFCPRYGFGKGLWFAVFHSISAFCNAGFDLMGTPDAAYVSLTGQHAFDPLVTLCISLLIILGGLGFLTWNDVVQHRHHFHRYRLQSKLVLYTSAILLAGGVLFFLWEFSSNSAWQHLTAAQRLQAAWFQSVTPRTAGFNTVDLSLLSPVAMVVTVALMLVGGSPGSTAGGFKTTTLALLLLNIRAVFRRRDNAHCFGRRIPDDSTQGAAAIFTLYLLLFLSGGVLICCIDAVPLMRAMFESASAIATVGLSLGVTPSLSALSRLILIVLMYLGRVGSLTLLYAVTAPTSTVSPSRFPEERVSVG